MAEVLCLGILVSGRGSNLAAIAAQIEAGRLAARVGVVISDNPLAPALRIAAEKRLPKAVVERKAFPDKASFETEIAAILKAHQVDLVVLAGFMRLLGPLLTAEFPDRIINVHPALLPAFPGLNAQKQALDRGVKIAGCTVHFVNEIMDGGPIIAQAAVPVLPDDTEESLSARILEEEHRLLPEAIGRLAPILTLRR
ncbi:MAG: phosphoribosylglycinamide formyltransferase [Candidatus Adiutrix sp.]|jgi:phosphoribosylglycinamide formyltransferase-1|nr:phosphoribosylglycinamide formyltransferase [Candidatus Adiutrix sp.]